MIDLKKKCWREKVTAEITLAHLQQFAQELGTNISAVEMAAFLNENGRAQSVWMHMMQAGEEFIKSSLEAQSIGTRTAKIGIHTINQNSTQVAGMVQ